MCILYSFIKADFFPHLLINAKWLRGRFANFKRVSPTLAKSFVCERCVEALREIMEQDEELSLCDQMDLVKKFCCVGDRLIVNGESEAAVTANIRITCIRFR